MAVFKDKIHLMKQLKLRLGIYGLKLPMTDSEIYEEVILGSTLGEFSMYNADVKTVMLDTEEDFDKECFNWHCVNSCFDWQRMDFCTTDYRCI